MTNLMDIVCGKPAVADLNEYFDDYRSKPYTGRRFDTLAGGGDRPGTQSRITASDLVAVQMLSVSVPAETAADLIDGRLGRQLADLLAEIPVAVELGTNGARELVADGEHADRAWHLLESQTNVGYVIAGKLLARKRPNLIPVYDQVVACLFGRPDRVWLRLHDRLAGDNGDLRNALATQRDRAKVPAAVSLLRVLDVVLWMSHRREHRSEACPGLGSLPLS